MDELERLDLQPYFNEDGQTIDLHNFIKANPSLRARCSKALDMFLSDILVETSHDLLQLEGGMDQLINHLAAAIKAPIACNQKVVALDVQQDHVQVSWLEAGQLHTRRCDYVLCTIPFSIVRQMDLSGFDDEKLAAIHNTFYCPATKVLFHCAQPFWQKDGITGGASFSDESIRQIYYPSVQGKPSKVSTLLASYTIGDDADYLGMMSETERHTFVKNAVSKLHPEIEAPGMVLDMVTAVPCVGRAVKPGPGPTHAIAAKLDLGELELRTVTSQRLVARIPTKAYQREAHQLTSGVVDVPLAEPFENLHHEIEQQGLCIVDGRGQILVQEQEINLQIDDACLFLEFPDWKRGKDYIEEIEIRSFVRGRPAPVETVYLRQFYNPKGLPQLRYEFERDSGNVGQIFHFPPSTELNIVHFKPGKREEINDFAPTCVVSTNSEGRGWVTLHGVQPGTTRVLLSAQPDELPCDPNQPDEAMIAYDNDDLLGFWSGAGSFAVRVLPDDWHLEDIEDEAVDFNLIYEHILAYYELCFSFMKAEVFSLADRCKVETYARLMWQMCDPRNRNKTYYMPPTRDLSQPKAMLLRKFLHNQQQVGYIPTSQPLPKRTQRTIQTRDELVTALRHAAELEVAVMLQYIYAAYSIPN